MGRYLIQPVPEMDFYIEWSSIIDQPVCWGTKDMFLDNTSYKEDDFQWAERGHGRTDHIVAIDSETSLWVTKENLMPFVLSFKEDDTYDAHYASILNEDGIPIEEIEPPC
jgi:hypothetical protein